MLCVSSSSLGAVNFSKERPPLANHWHERDAGSNSGSFLTLSKGNRSIETEGAKPSVGRSPFHHRKPNFVVDDPSLPRRTKIERDGRGGGGKPFLLPSVLTAPPTMKGMAPGRLISFEMKAPQGSFRCHGGDAAGVVGRYGGY